MIAAGIAVGMLAAFACGRLLESQLFEVRASDPTTYAGVAFALSLTGIAACLAPALRALRVDPIVALRTE